LQDWQSAYDYVTGQLGDAVDTSKVLLWGTSFGGGHALTTAAKLRENITAVVAQVGWLLLELLEVVGSSWVGGFHLVGSAMVCMCA
jgi:dienelactone hydrolase